MFPPSESGGGIVLDEDIEIPGLSHADSDISRVSAIRSSISASQYPRGREKSVKNLFKKPEDDNGEVLSRYDGFGTCYKAELQEAREELERSLSDTTF